MDAVGGRLIRLTGLHSATSKSIRGLQPQHDISSLGVNWHCRHAVERPIKTTAAATAFVDKSHVAGRVNRDLLWVATMPSYDPETVRRRIDLQTRRFDR